MNGSGCISILGSTGSIGTQTLEVAEKLSIPVAAITGNRRIELLEAQARRFRPKLAAVADEEAGKSLRVRLADTGVRVIYGAGGLLEAAAVSEADTVVTAVVGTAGLLPTLTAIDEGKRIALANKETLVCAGEIVMTRARLKGAEIIPVDSEHSAIFQCLGERRDVEPKNILLTASGGSFRGKKAEELREITPEQACKNPNWSMGAKVTVDSATLMNKGLEFIEAMHLFGVSPDMIRILVHPQSIVHSMVEFKDNSIIAQMAVPDMRLPIQYALTYPNRMPSLAGQLDLTAQPLTFERPDTETFKCLPLAMDAAVRGGTACAVLNAANEAAVGLFLRKKLGFMDIYESVAAALDNIENVKSPSLDDILDADVRARRFVEDSAV